MVPAAEVGDLRDGLRVQTRVNGTTVQDGTTDQMVYTVGDTLAHISRTFTLQPGDLLATGTPSGRRLRPHPTVAAPARRRRRGRGRPAGRAAQHHRRQRLSTREPHGVDDRRHPLTPLRDREATACPANSGSTSSPAITPAWPRSAASTPYAYRDVARTPGTFTGDLVDGWTPLYLDAFRGVTENGTLREDVHRLRAGPARRSSTGCRDGRRRPGSARRPRRGRPRPPLLTPSMPCSGRPGPTPSSCSSTPACGWNSSRPRCGTTRWRWCGRR